MKLFNKETETTLIELGWKIEDLKLAGRSDHFNGCNWWSLTYKFLHFSIYFDPSNILGYVGDEYYELYDGNDTYRYHTDKSNIIIKDLTKFKNVHNKEINEFPELWL